VQEALTNVVKHAGAETVSIVVARRGAGVSAVVEDDGRGFEAGEVREDALGIVGMRERLALLDGTLTVESTPRVGTSIAAYVPLAPPGDA
jgi:signal transduction histidine kinase